ncbi:MAG: cytochrome c [Vicingus serpentipes]|nr:cytochrome c [Vicingus serpentipes]
MKIKLKLIAVTTGALFYGLGVNAQDGEALFKQTCAACHTVGGGKLVGPDLQGVNKKRTEDWIVNFVKSAADFGAKDADAKAMIAEYGYPMPNQNLGEGDVKAIINYIAANSPTEEIATEGGAPAEEIVAEPADPALDPANASAEDIAFGLKLFSGENRLANGGPSCLTCHNVEHTDLIAGGLLAKDLTKVYERMGAAGLNGILSSPPFPAMNASYKDNPLTEKEIFQLSAFFSDASVNNIYQKQRAYNDNLLLYGGGGAFATIAIVIFFLFLERKRKCVKEDIYKRQTKAASSK